MADKTSLRTEYAPNLGGKIVVLESDATVTGGTDTLTLTLADFGLSKISSVYGVVHTTEDSVMVQESGTTAVAAGVLTYTSASGNDNKKRVVTVIGK
jgi:hypothetical protein